MNQDLDLAAADAAVRARVLIYAGIVIDLVPDFDDDKNLVYLLGAAGISHDAPLARIEAGLKRLATKICAEKFLDLAVLVGAAIEVAAATKH